MIRWFPLAAIFVVSPALANGDSGVTCTASNTLINFGQYDVLADAPLDGAGSFTVTCSQSGNQPVAVVYSAKLATAPPRRLSPLAGTDRLSYDVYVDAARTLPWGDGTVGTFVISGAVTVPARSSVTDAPKFYYGRISPGGQDVSTALFYGQILTVTVTCQPSPPC
jgi:spore coat protein U-like protein